MTPGDIAKLLAPLRMRAANMLAKAVVALVNDGTKLQRLQITVLKGETRNDVDRIQDYGLTSHPEPGARAVALFLGGDRGNGLVVAVDDERYRVKVAAGEVALYAKWGQVVHLRADTGLTIVALGDVELRGRHVRIHGTESVTLDCAGHGVVYTPDRVHTWTEGAVAGTSNPISAPAIPHDPPAGPAPDLHDVPAP